jgi:DNA helicase II / ATP-dependent DNA helicase PcrA
MQDFRKYLNPIYKELETISNTDDLIASTPAETEEFSHLADTLKTIIKKVHKQIYFVDELVKDIERTEELIRSETGDDRSDAVGEMNKLLSQMDRLLTLTNRYLDIVNSPYFGRIVFDRKENEQYPARKINTYLGKSALIDPKTNIPLITDWRAPIANLYYQNSGPENDLSFIAPVGPQHGDLILKRQFEIASGRISSIYEAKSGNAAVDQFLLKQLENRIGKKLQDIVSTIQAQQNEIIREEKDRPSIIQGVAGSGKTTIILHRMAYLFFTYPDEIQPENSLIIAPNTMFLDYISDVLPSLGVEGMQQNTYINWARSLLKWDKKYHIAQNPDNNEVKVIKGDTKFLRLTETFFEFFEYDLFEKMPDFINLEVHARYQEMRREYPAMSILEVIGLSVDYAFAQRQFKRKGYVGDYMGELHDQEDRKKKIKAYVTKRTNPYNLYKEMISHKRIFAESGYSKEEIELIGKFTKPTFKRQGKGIPYKVEDLPPIVWFYLKLHGIKSNIKDYIVVDEAQDLSIFQLLTINLVARNGNITIAGDTAQAIIPPFYIQDWNNLKDAIKVEMDSQKVQKEIAYHQLFRCYRTTVEIIEFANEIFAKHFPKGYKLPEAVLRHGEDVSIMKFEKNTAKTSENDVKKLIKEVNKQFENDAVTVALITKDEKTAEDIYEKLNTKSEEFKRSIHLYKEDDYRDGVLVLPVSRAKGLEFDSVFVMDVNEDTYVEDDLSVRLLYVAITRALHRLYIIHSDKPSKLIS